VLASHSDLRWAMATNLTSDPRNWGRRALSWLALLISILSVCSALAQVKGDAISSTFRIIGRDASSHDFPHYSGKSNFQEIVQAAKDGFRIMRVPVSSPFVSFVMERYGDANRPYSYKLFEAAFHRKLLKSSTSPQRVDFG
jgi:hypothetical protein